MDILLVLFAPLCNVQLASIVPAGYSTTIAGCSTLKPGYGSMQPCAGKYDQIYSLSDLMSLSTSVATLELSLQQLRESVTDRQIHKHTSADWFQ